jgi:hypothetical protein
MTLPMGYYRIYDYFFIRMPPIITKLVLFSDWPTKTKYGIPRQKKLPAFSPEKMMVVVEFT